MLLPFRLPEDVESVRIQTDKGLATVEWTDESKNGEEPQKSLSFSILADQEYAFVFLGESGLTIDDISLINQKKGYSNAIYLLSVFLAIFMILTFYSTRERVKPPKEQQTNLGRDFKDLIKNRPWIVLLLIGLLFQVYNAIKQGIAVIYFTHYMQNQMLVASYLVALMVASIGGAMVTGWLGKKLGKKELFIYAFLFSGAVNALFIFCGPSNVTWIFTIGILSEVSAAVFPTLFFAMLGDAADYSEFKNGRRATGLVYSAGSFSTKFGGGVAGVIIGLVLSAYNYNGLDTSTMAGAAPGIVMLMSWIPSVVALIAAIVMAFYPLNQSKMDAITIELNKRRVTETKRLGG